LVKRGQAPGKVLRLIEMRDDDRDQHSLGISGSGAGGGVPGRSDFYYVYVIQRQIPTALQSPAKIRRTRHFCAPPDVGEQCAPRAHFLQV